MTRFDEVRTSICSLALCAACASLWTGFGYSESQQQERSAALITAKDDAYGPVVGSRRLTLDRTRLDAIKELPIGQKIPVEKLPLADGTLVEVELERVDVFTDDAYVRVMRSSPDRDGYQEERLAVPNVLMLAGRLIDDPDSIVFLSVQDDNVMGYVRTAERTEIISSGAPGNRKAPVIYNPAAVPADAFNFKERQMACNHSSDLMRPQPRKYPELSQTSKEDEASGGLANGLTGCKQVRMAIDSDADMLNLGFGGSTSELLVYVIQLAAAQNEIFKQDVHVNLSIAYVTVWDTDDEPWTRPDNDPDLTDIEEQQLEYYNWYNANEDEDDYDLAHLLVFDSVGGGIAWRAELCDDGPFAVSTGLECSFPYPLETHHESNYDISLFAHENGHILGGRHTHEFCPPIDQCASGSSMGECQDETICQRGTLMGYCDVSCPGGMLNVHLGFHPENVLLMREHISDGSCLSSVGSSVNAFNDSTSTLEGVTVAIDILANDRSTCLIPLILEIPESTDFGGTLELVFNTFPFDRSQLLYTPPDGFTGTDSFEYTCFVGLFDDIDDATVQIDVTERPITLHELLVLDNEQDAVFRFDGDTGQYLGVLVDSGAGGIEAPTSMAFGPDGDIYVTSFVTDDVRRFDGETGAPKGVFYSSSLKNPISIQIDDSYAYILGSDSEISPTNPFPKLQLVKASLSTGSTVTTYVQTFTIGIDLDLRSDGALIMLVQAVGDDLIQLDPSSFAVDATFSPAPYGVSMPLCANGRGAIALLDAEDHNIVRLNPNNFAFQSQTSWDESDYANFVPLEILYAEFGTEYCLHDRGISTFTSSSLSDLIGLSPAHLHSPRAMLIRDLAEPIAGDYNGDGRVNGQDLAVLLGAFGQYSEIDLSGDGFVDGEDLALLLGRWTING